MAGDAVIRPCLVLTWVTGDRGSRRRTFGHRFHASRSHRMTPFYAILGVILVIVSIPLGLMVAPLAIGGILLWVALRRADRALQGAATTAWRAS